MKFFNGIYFVIAVWMVFGMLFGFAWLIVLLEKQTHLNPLLIVAIFGTLLTFFIGSMLP